MVSSSKRVIIRLSLFLFFIFITLNTGMIYAQTDTVSGTIGTYSFPAGSYEVVSRAADIFSPLEIISQGETPSSTYTYVADGNGYLSVDFQPTAGTGWLVLELNGEAYGYGTADGFSKNVQNGETVTFKVSAPAYQTDYEMVQDEQSGEITFTDTYSWNNTAGLIAFNLTLSDVPEVEFGWHPRDPASGDDVTFYTSMNTMTLNSMTWLINDVVIDYAQDSSQWTYSNIQDGVYEVTLQVEDQYGVPAQKTYTITVGNQQVFHGVVFDDLGNRYEALTVHFYWNDVLQGTTYTDADGYYEFTTVNGQPITLPLTGMGEVKIEFVDKDHVFEIRDLKADKTKPVSVTYPVTAITSVDQLEYNIGFYGDMSDDTDTPKVNEALTDDHALIFYYTNIAKRFYDQKLNYIFWNTPLYVTTDDRNTNEAYFKSGGNPEIDGKTTYPMIYYSSQALKRTDPDTPLNREFHEFNHYIMWDYYGELPERHYFWDASAGKWVPLDRNHWGVSNHCTSDSYLEAFAEFMSLVINKEMNVKPPTTTMLPDFAWSRYTVGGASEYFGYNRDQSYKVEEFSFASVLWDLYDGKEVADSDNVDLTLEQVWDILMQIYVLPKYYENDDTTGLLIKLDETTTEVRHINYIKDLYDGLIENEPFHDYSTTDINAIFVSHKIFNDTNADGTWQQGEPIGINLKWGTERRKHPVDESWLLTLDIPESMLPTNITVTTTHEESFTQYDHEYTVTIYDYPAQIPIIMPPEKYTPEMKVEVTKQGYTDTNPLVLDVATYNELINTQGNLGQHTPSLETIEETEYIYINQVDSPTSVEAGSTITLTVSLEYSFNEITMISLGVYDYATESYVVDETYWVQGTEVEDYLIQFTAPDTLQTLELEANVIYQIGEEWYYTDNDLWYNYFTIEIVEAANEGIPGYPLPAILAGITIGLLILQRKQNKLF